MRRLHTTVLVVGLVAAAGACTADEPVPSPSPAPTSTGPATEAPTTSGPATDGPATDGELLGAAGAADALPAGVDLVAEVTGAGSGGAQEIPFTPTHAAATVLVACTGEAPLTLALDPAAGLLGIDGQQCSSTPLEVVARSGVASGSTTAAVTVEQGARWQLRVLSCPPQDFPQGCPSGL